MSVKKIDVVVIDKNNPTDSMSFLVSNLEEFVQEFWREDTEEFRESKYVRLFYGLCDTRTSYVDIDDEFLYFFS